LGKREKGRREYRKGSIREYSQARPDNAGTWAGDQTPERPGDREDRQTLYHQNSVNFDKDTVPADKSNPDQSPRCGKR